MHLSIPLCRHWSLPVQILIKLCTYFKFVYNVMFPFWESTGLLTTLHIVRVHPYWLSAGLHGKIRRNLIGYCIRNVQFWQCSGDTAFATSEIFYTHASQGSLFLQIWVSKVIHVHVYGCFDIIRFWNFLRKRWKMTLFDWLEKSKNWDRRRNLHNLSLDFDCHCQEMFSKISLTTTSICSIHVWSFALVFRMLIAVK